MARNSVVVRAGTTSLPLGPSHRHRVEFLCGVGLGVTLGVLLVVRLQAPTAELDAGEAATIEKLKPDVDAATKVKRPQSEARTDIAAFN